MFVVVVLGVVKFVFVVGDEDEVVKKRDMSVKSNVMSVSVIMFWVRIEVLKVVMVEMFLSKILYVWCVNNNEGSWLIL